MVRWLNCFGVKSRLNRQWANNQQIPFQPNRYDAPLYCDRAF
ncbi:hypothetical protein BRPE64_BCDS09280 [Caballeronia insecticola]|uniref:Uncharacterized protein n=1 Tax=Caballeronia insecticola TaxID=758793 RepID=R4WM45_9BURK|nr:hypothetical protein BRPE64_BCDS09280 [Caballeronia insecticola]